MNARVLQLLNGCKDYIIRSENKIAVLQRVLESYSDKLANNFIIVTEKTVRIVEERRNKLGGKGV